MVVVIFAISWLVTRPIVIQLHPLLLTHYILHLAVRLPSNNVQNLMLVILFEIRTAKCMSIPMGIASAIL